MALSKQERKEMARKAMEKRGSKKPDGSGFARIDADAKKLENEWLLKKAPATTSGSFFTIIRGQ